MEQTMYEQIQYETSNISNFEKSEMHFLQFKKKQN